MQRHKLDAGRRTAPRSTAAKLFRERELIDAKPREEPWFRGWQDIGIGCSHTEGTTDLLVELHRKPERVDNIKELLCKPGLVSEVRRKIGKALEGNKNPVRFADFVRAQAIHVLYNCLKFEDRRRELGRGILKENLELSLCAREALFKVIHAPLPKTELRKLRAMIILKGCEMGGARAREIVDACKTHQRGKELCSQCYPLPTELDTSDVSTLLAQGRGLLDTFNKNLRKTFGMIDRDPKQLDGVSMLLDCRQEYYPVPQNAAKLLLLSTLRKYNVAAHAMDLLYDLIVYHPMGDYHSLETIATAGRRLLKDLDKRQRARIMEPVKTCEAILRFSSSRSNY
ncbi:TPA: hypothetical protein HA238_05905 [Candidatus Micrarchaeota archaeon]|nr:hypothetical protein [Candidatus Micrarchaeota archaeon]